MSGEWLKYGVKEINPRHYDGYAVRPTYEIRYANRAKEAIIRSIKICKMSNGEFIALLTCSPLGFEKATNKCKTVGFTDDEIEQSPVFARALIKKFYVRQPSSTVEKILNFFSQINKESREFPADFIKNFSKLFKQKQDDGQVIFSENLSEFIAESEARGAHVNPAKEHDFSLSELIEKRIKKRIPEAEFYEQIKELLVEGHNPNQVDRHGNTPLIRALLLPTKLIELLLAYSADPFFIYTEESQFWPFNAIEFAFKDKNTEHYNIFKLAFAKFDRKKWVSDIKVNAIEDKVVTEICLDSGKKFVTRLEKLTELKKAERDKLSEIYVTCFKDPHGNQENLQDNVKDAFTPKPYPHKMKVVDLIYALNSNKEELAGAILIELIKLANDIIVTHCEYAFIAHEHRQLPMTSMLYRVAYMIQLLLPNYVIPVYGSYVDYHSYDLIFSYHFLHATRVLSAFVEELIHAILAEASGDGKIKFKKLMTWLIEEEHLIEVIQSKNKSKIIRLVEKFFKEYLIGNMKGYAPVLFLVEGDSLRKICYFSEKENNIQFKPYIAVFTQAVIKARILEGFIYQEKPSFNMPIYFWKHRELFFNRKKIPSNENIDMTKYSSKKVRYVTQVSRIRSKL